MEYRNAVNKPDGSGVVDRLEVLGILQASPKDGEKMGWSPYSNFRYSPNNEYLVVVLTKDRWYVAEIEHRQASQIEHEHWRIKDDSPRKMVRRYKDTTVKDVIDAAMMLDLIPMASYEEYEERLGVECS